MFDSMTLITFLVASVAIIIAPGPAQALALTRTLGEGRAAGAMTALGLNVGTLAHALAAALGLSAILATSAVAFGVVKYVGAAYLIYLKPLAAGEQLEATVSENRVEPGVKLALLIEPAERLKRVEKRLLNRVQCVFTVAHNSQRVPDRAPLIFLNQVSEGFPISRQALLYSRRVIHHCLSLTCIPAAWKIFNGPHFLIQNLRS